MHNRCLRLNYERTRKDEVQSTTVFDIVHHLEMSSKLVMSMMKWDVK